MSSNEPFNMSSKLRAKQILPLSDTEGISMDYFRVDVYISFNSTIAFYVTPQGFITLAVVEASQGHGRREFLRIIVKYTTENSATTRPSQGAGLIQGQVSFIDLKLYFGSKFKGGSLSRIYGICL